MTHPARIKQPAARLSCMLSAWLLAACAQAPTTPGTTPGALPSTTAAPPASAPPTATPPLPTLALQGQLGIKLGAWGAEPARGMSFGFFFQGQVDGGSLSLMTPLGSQVAQLEWDASAATLRRIGPGGGPDIRRGSLAELGQSILGEDLPLSTLMHWMQGQPDPSLPHRSTPQAGTFEQHGWLIDTRERAQGRILATRQGQPGLRDARIQVRLDP